MSQVFETIIRQCSTVAEAEGASMEKGDPLWCLRRLAAVELFLGLLDGVDDEGDPPE